jgi:hypothetical protein
MEFSAGIIQLHEADNVCLCTRSIKAAEKLMIGDKPVVAPVDLGIGHKLAIRPIGTGEPVIKYGIVIGVATANIDTGDHVHTHNIKSNYIPTYLNS